MNPIITALLPVLEALFRYVWNKYDSVDDAWHDLSATLTDGKVTKASLPNLDADLAALHELADKVDPGATLAAFEAKHASSFPRFPPRDAGGFTAPESTIEPTPDTLRGEDLK